MSSTTRTVVYAAAGTGKTTRLVNHYLELLKRFPPSRIIAITFTRKAAAELIERVAWSLGTALGDSRVPDHFKAEFEQIYGKAVPRDPALLENALVELPNAPIGTTDSFVQGLLNEFALDARVPTGDAHESWLDLPIGAGNASAAFEAAARDVVDPRTGRLPDETTRLLDHLTLADVLAQVTALAGDPDAWQALTTKSLLDELLRGASGAFLAAYDPSDAVAVEKDTRKGALPYWPAVQEWLRAGAEAKAAPVELLGWCADRLEGDRFKTTTTALVEAFAERTVDLGVVTLSLAALLKPGKNGRYLPATIATADQIRTDLSSLARRVRPRALSRAAEEGALDHGLLTDVAIALCEQPPARLRQRFDALLVDEAQDSSPQQFRLFRALEDLPGAGRSLESFYVGDVRQSIYLFRGAEPREFEKLRAETENVGVVDELKTNYRSSASLVAAQKALFGAVTLQGVDPLAKVNAADGAAKKDLPAEAGGPEPVWLVCQDPPVPPPGEAWNSAQANATALDVFVERLQKAWAHPGRERDTAAVLTTSWHKAQLACERLRELLGGPDRAFVDGTSGLTRGRVARDLRLLVQAFWDRADDVAWAGVWKHPMVNLSDGALVLLKEGTGVTFDGDVHGHGLSGAVSAVGLDETLYPAADVAAFRRARPLLARALEGIGREPTADLLDRLAADLQWRALLLAGPDGLDGAAELEVVLDWIRSAEADGVDPGAVVDLLDPDQGDEAPRVELHRPPRSVSCTTIHQAKGLQYDHVFVYDLGTSPPGASNDGWARARAALGGVEGELVGVTFDPAGALQPATDLVARVAEAVWEARKNEERLRLAYVAITRAKRSATFALYGAGRGIHDSLVAAWLGAMNEQGLAGVRVVRREGPRDLKVTIEAHARAVGSFSVPRAEPRGWTLVAPSGAADDWDKKDRAELVKRVAAAAEILPGGEAASPPAVTDDVLKRRGDPGADAFWGTVAHGWLAHTRLSVSPSSDQAVAYLAEQGLNGAVDEAAAATWLLGLSATLADRRKALMAELRSPDATLLFEHPFVGVDETDSDHQRLHAGRMDLLVTWPGKRAWVIDFKVGKHAPTSRDDVARQANLNEYAPQVEAYRRSLERMGWTVVKVGLLFPRSGAFVGW